MKFNLKLFVTILSLTYLSEAYCSATDPQKEQCQKLMQQAMHQCTAWSHEAGRTGEKFQERFKTCVIISDELQKCKAGQKYDFSAWEKMKSGKKD